MRNHIHWLGKSSRVFCSHVHLNLASLARRDCLCRANVAFEDSKSKEMSSKRIYWCILSKNEINLIQSFFKAASKMPNRYQDDLSTYISEREILLPY